jgi:hypothetical protein
MQAKNALTREGRMTATIEDQAEQTYTKIRVTGSLTVEFEAEILVPGGTDVDVERLEGVLEPDATVSFTTFSDDYVALSEDTTDTPVIDLNGHEVLATGLDEDGEPFYDDEEE